MIKASLRKYEEPILPCTNCKNSSPVVCFKMRHNLMRYTFSGLEEVVFVKCTNCNWIGTQVKNDRQDATSIAIKEWNKCRQLHLATKGLL